MSEELEKLKQKTFLVLNGNMTKYYPLKEGDAIVKLEDVENVLKERDKRVRKLAKLLRDFPDINDSKYWVKIKEGKGSKAFISLMYIADVLFWKIKFEKEILGEDK